MSTNVMENLKNELNRKLDGEKVENYINTNHIDKRLLNPIKKYLKKDYSRNSSKENIKEVCKAFNIDINDVYEFTNEPDSTRRTFNYYEIVYSKTIGNFDYDISDSGRRCIQYNYDKMNSILLGGDVIFNFKEIKCRPFIQQQRSNIVDNAKYEDELKRNFKDSKIEDFFVLAKQNEKKLDEYDREHINQLIICRLLTYSLINYSLMPITGALNITKQNYGNDRFDKFVYMLNCFYEDNDRSLTDFSQDNAENILKFLDSFEPLNNGFRNYMCFFYQFEYKQNLENFDTGLVDEFLESRKMSFAEQYNTLEYLKLAFRFWSYRLNKIYELASADKNIKEELDWIKNLLDNWCKQDGILNYEEYKNIRNKLTNDFSVVS